MMRNLQRRGKELADKHARKSRAQIAERLSETLPEHALVEVDGDEIEIKARGLSDEIITNGSLRDVGFLLRGLR